MQTGTCALKPVMACDSRLDKAKLASKGKPSAKDVKFEGVVNFPSSPATSYHYKIFHKDDRIGFWLEDRESKLQWCVNELMWRMGEIGSS